MVGKYTEDLGYRLDSGRCPEPRHTSVVRGVGNRLVGGSVFHLGYSGGRLLCGSVGEGEVWTHTS